MSSAKTISQQLSEFEVAGGEDVEEEHQSKKWQAS